jgi:signal transduction histidine kinase/FixJ family two-component response regulator
MAGVASIASPLLARARADQVATLYRSWHRTTISMALGALILCLVLWEQESALGMSMWFGAILANQAWRGVLARAYRRAAPSLADAPRWGRYWTVGATLAGALWGIAAFAMFPASPPHQALLIVCLFSVILGGLNLTAVYTPSFLGFVLAALVPLIARVAMEGGQVHLFTALVLLVVLGFVLGFGRQLNHVLTLSLAMRHENVDLIDELKVETRLAESARAAAETANRAKSQFLAAASHDLRQPLHAIGLFAAALAARARDPNVAPLIANIHASIEALEGLFAQLLDLSRLEAGALHPQFEDVALEPLLARICADFAPQAALHGLVLRSVHTSAEVITDPLLLERILRNLIGNALRYTRRGGVVVGVRRCGAEFRIDVIDSGVGIAAIDHQRIFDEFVQLGPSPHRHAGGRGLGLGLTIVRRLSALLGHGLDVGSAPGAGSRFSISLPRAARRPSVRLRGTQPVVAAGSDGASPFAGRSVAVVDDDPAVVSAMEALFTSWGAHVVAGTSAAATLTALQDGRADLIVADLRLADGESGIEAVTAIRAAQGGGSVPALIVSGDTGDDARKETSAAGITLLSKPLIVTALFKAAEAALAPPPPAQCADRAKARPAHGRVDAIDRLLEGRPHQ